MIIRFVKLTIRKESINEFRDFFHERNKQIAEFEGCRKVELLQDTADERVFFTYSEWEKPEHLELYRNSDFFQETWKKAKTVFDDKPLAWSLKQS